MLDRKTNKLKKDYNCRVKQQNYNKSLKNIYKYRNEMKMKSTNLKKYL